MWASYIASNLENLLFPTEQNSIAKSFIQQIGREAELNPSTNNFYSLAYKPWKPQPPEVAHLPHKAYEEKRVF